MTTEGTWHVAEGREQRASVKEEGKQRGHKKLNKLHQMAETKRK